RGLGVWKVSLPRLDPWTEDSVEHLERLPEPSMLFGPVIAVQWIGRTAEHHVAFCLIGQFAPLQLAPQLGLDSLPVTSQRSEVGLGERAAEDEPDADLSLGSDESRREVKVRAADRKARPGPGERLLRPHEALGFDQVRPECRPVLQPERAGCGTAG